MHKFATLAQLILINLAARRSLARTPEPEPITDQTENVKEYDNALTTNMVGNYTVTLDFIHRCLPNVDRELAALDLCSGPGHLALNMVKNFNIRQLRGIDLSSPMVALANNNSIKYGLVKKAQFQLGDVRKELKNAPSASYDLVTFNNSAHHLPSLDAVSEVLHEINRVAKPEGLIVVTDMARLKNTKMTDKFVEFVGSDYLRAGMPHMYEDFKNTMYAAWTPEELNSTVPPIGHHAWYHVVPKALPFFQVIIGVPMGQGELYLRPSRNWETADILARPEAKTDYHQLQNLFASASVVRVAPSEQGKKAA